MSRFQSRVSIVFRVERCNQCERQGTLFGLRDIVSGRFGWCSFCNWKSQWEPVVQMIDEFCLPIPVRARLIEFLVEKPPLGRVEAAEMIEPGIFFELLRQQLPLDRVASVWHLSTGQYEQPCNATFTGFSRKYIGRFMQFLGDEPDLHQWQKATVDFLSRQCPRGEPNFFKWKDARAPHKDWGLREHDIKWIAFVTCHQFACALLELDVVYGESSTGARQLSALLDSHSPAIS